MEFQKFSQLGDSKCVRYALQEGEICEHSCACDAQLQCFKEFPIFANITSTISFSNENILKVNYSFNKFIQAIDISKIT